MNNPRTRSCIVVDAPDDVQEWVDRLVAVSINAKTTPDTRASREGLTPLPTVITLPALWKAINRNFQANGGGPYSVAERGLPVIPKETPTRDHPDPHYNGDALHALAHAILGNFHS